MNFMKKEEKIIKSFDLIKETWKVYQKNVLKFIEVFVYGLVGMIPIFAVLLLVLAYGATGLAGSASLYTNVVFGIIAFILFLISVYIAIVYSIRIKVASILLLKNNFTPAKDNFKEAKPYFVKFLGVSLLMMVLIIAWGFAAIIPALIFAVYYGFAQYILVAEDKRPFSAIERSYDLVRGYFWPTFGRLALLALIGMLAYMVIGIPLSWMKEGGMASFTYSVFMNLVWAILSPYFMIYSYNLYKSLKETNK
jgi:hypothetical protein